MSTTHLPYSLAILDDYASIAPAHFAHISPTKLAVTTMPYPLPPSDLIARLTPFTILSTMRERTPFPASILHNLPNLKLILTTGPRNAAIDLPACTEHGVVVVGTGGSKKGKGSSNQDPERSGEAAPTTFDPTTQHTWALILGLAGNISRGHQDITRGGWQSHMLLNTSLAGKTLGILGLGRLGAQIARIGAIAFGMRVICWSANLTQKKADEAASQAGIEKGSYHVVTKEVLFQTADVLSVHYVLGARSVGIVGASELAAMKPTAMFINTSRGKLVDEGALLEVLKERRIKGAALDVFFTEPLAADSEWRTTRWGEEGTSEVLMSPHMGYVEEKTMHGWYDEQAENLERWIEGKELLPRLN